MNKDIESFVELLTDLDIDYTINYISGLVTRDIQAITITVDETVGHKCEFIFNPDGSIMR